MPKIVVCDMTYEEAEFEKRCALFRKMLPESEIRHYVPDENYVQELADVEYILTSYVPFGKKYFAAAKKLQAISVTGTGYTNIDCAAAKKHKVAVYHVRDYCTQEVSIHAVSMMLALMRGLKKQDHHINRSLKWDYTYASVTVPYGKNVVIYGFGKIAKQTVATLAAMGMRVYVVSRHADSEVVRRHGAEKIEPEDVAAVADVIINHQSADGLPVHYFDEVWFYSLKRRPLFINVGRGISVDENALCEALDAGFVSGAGIDVLENENPDLKNCKLLHRGNVILTPHSAFYSERSMNELRTQACMNLVNHMRGETDYAGNRVV